MIATTDKACYGLEDYTKKEADEIVRDMVGGKQALIFDPDKAAEVAVRVAMEMAPKRKKELITADQVPELAKDHRLCNLCSQVCPNLLPVGDAIEAAKNGPP